MAYEDKLIEHLSKEIEVHTNNLMTFRARINLVVFLGPFALLGSILIGAKGVPRGITLDRWGVVACIGLGVSYIVLGMASAVVETHIWRQCNAWRGLIATIVSDPSFKTRQEHLAFGEALKRGYAVVYLAMMLAFLCVTVIVSRLDVIASK